MLFASDSHLFQLKDEIYKKTVFGFTVDKDDMSNKISTRAVMHKICSTRNALNFKASKLNRKF